MNEDKYLGWNTSNFYNNIRLPYFPFSNQPTIVKDKKYSRNESCPCGSGKKVKKCCNNKFR